MVNLVLALLSLYVPPAPGVPTADWSPWQYSVGSLKYREQYTSKCGGDKSRAKYHYHQFANEGGPTKKFKATFSYFNDKNELEETNDLHELKTGEMEQPSGTWRCAVPGTIRWNVKDGWD